MPKEVFNLLVRSGSILMLSWIASSAQETMTFIAPVFCWSLAPSYLSWQTIKDLFNFSCKNIRVLNINSLFTQSCFECFKKHCQQQSILNQLGQSNNYHNVLLYVLSQAEWKYTWKYMAPFQKSLGSWPRVRVELSSIL